MLQGDCATRLLELDRNAGVFVARSIEPDLPAPADDAQLFESHSVQVPAVTLGSMCEFWRLSQPAATAP